MTIVHLLLYLIPVIIIFIVVLVNIIIIIIIIIIIFIIIIHYYCFIFYLNVSIINWALPTVDPSLAWRMFYIRSDTDNLCVCVCV